MAVTTYSVTRSRASLLLVEGTFRGGPGLKVLGGSRADVVISEMAPNMMGMTYVDIPAAGGRYGWADSGGWAYNWCKVSEKAFS